MQANILYMMNIDVWARWKQYRRVSTCIRAIAWHGICFGQPYLVFFSHCIEVRTLPLLLFARCTISQFAIDFALCANIAEGKLTIYNHKRAFSPFDRFGSFWCHKIFLNHPLSNGTSFVGICFKKCKNYRTPVPDTLTIIHVSLKTSIKA